MSAEKEVLRQQMLLRALWRDARPGVLAGWCRDGAQQARGLQAYQANAGALAERALRAAYPTVAQLLGEESFAALARALWHRQPPRVGDVAVWGDGLAVFIAQAQGPQDEAYVPDVARLDWAVHLASSAADDAAAPRGLQRLAEPDPGALTLLARPGTALLDSPHPVVSLWQAHRAAGVERADRFAAVRAALALALAQGQAEAALVWRRGWRVEVAALGAAEARFTRAVLDGQNLGSALDAVGEAGGFDFEDWLLTTLQRGWLAGTHSPDQGGAGRAAATQYLG